MNIGVIVYSLSGHTLSVAVKLMEVLPAFGHELTLERVETVGPAKLKTEGAELKTMPLVMPYDILILGAPVRGGTLPSPMRRFLVQIPSLQDKKIACFVTHFFCTSMGRRPNHRAAARDLRIERRDRHWIRECEMV